MRRIMGRAGLYLLPYPKAEGDDGVPVEDVRAVATEAALATAVDASPAVLVSLWAHDQRLHPGDERPPPRRGR